MFDIDRTNPENDMFCNMLTMLKGEQWKGMRMVMSPVFTSGKLKLMAPIIDKARLIINCSYIASTIFVSSFTI